MREFDETKIKKDLMVDARAIGIPSGAAKSFIDLSLKDAKKALKPRAIITERDLTKALVKELKKYNADFAYVYQNRDKII